MLLSHASVFFPGSVITTRFGWDPTPPGPRIHHAIDRAGPGDLYTPEDYLRATWIPKDAQGNTILRLIGEGRELRIYHLYLTELSPTLREAIGLGKDVPAGTKIGPAGNVGIFVASAKGTGRHAHYVYYVDPQQHEEELDKRLTGWQINRIKEIEAKLGRAFTDEIKKREISAYNDLAITKLDPWTKRVRVIVNTYAGWGM